MTPFSLAGHGCLRRRLDSQGMVAATLSAAAPLPSYMTPSSLAGHGCLRQRLDSQGTVAIQAIGRHTAT